MQVIKIELYKTRRGKRKSDGHVYSLFFTYSNGQERKIADASETFINLVTESMLRNIAKCNGHVHMLCNGWIWCLYGFSLLDQIAH